jgi:hypothetical protein
MLWLCLEITADLGRLKTNQILWICLGIIKYLTKVGVETTQKLWLCPGITPDCGRVRTDQILWLYPGIIPD